MTPPVGLLLRKERTTLRAKKVFPVLDSPARAVTLLEGIPPKREPLTTALKMYDPVSTNEVTSPAATPSETILANSFQLSLITLSRNDAIHLPHFRTF